MCATEPHFTPHYGQLAAQESIAAGTIFQSDKVYQCGSGEGWLQDCGV